MGENSFKIFTDDLLNEIHFIKLTYDSKVQTFKFLKASNFN